MRSPILSSLLSKFVTAMVILAMVLVALPATPAYAASIEVTTTDDELTDNGFCSLREAIINANTDGAEPGPHPDCEKGAAHDTITLQSGSIYTLSLAGTDPTGGDLDITDQDGLTIQANGAGQAIIDGNDIDRVFEATPGSGPLTLIGITITNGTAIDSAGRGGGMIYDSNATLTLNNTIFSNNVATSVSSCGGGLYTSSLAEINIMNSTFEGNSCTGEGGDGGALWKGSGGTLNITNSTFNNNTAVTDDGGAMRVEVATVTITNSTFANNTAQDVGGAIEVDGNANVTINFSTFSGNTANDAGNNGGGALYVSSGIASVNGSILANSVDGQDCAVSDPLVGTATIDNSIIENNVNCTLVSVITSNPNLQPLANYGGVTETMAITNTSSAFDTATSCDPVTTDQRGFTRPQFADCDLGSFELQDTEAPVVLSVTRTGASPTNAASVGFSVIFSKPVDGVDTGDFDTVEGGGLTGSTVSNVTGSDTTYTVTVTTGTGTGTLQLIVDDDDSIQDTVNNIPLGGVGANNGDFNSGEIYTVDKTGPVVSSITRAGASPTSASSVNFTVTFSEAVSEVDVADFNLNTTGVSGATVTGVSGSGASRTVTVSTGSGGGTIRLDLIDNDTVVDAVGNPLGGTGAGNGSFTTGEVYDIEEVINGDTTGVFRPSNGALYLKNSNTTGFADIQINYGLGGDYPVTGDWDGDGDDTIGVYRGGLFYLRNANTIGFADLVFAFGSPGDQPVAGDWNGDEVDTIGVYRNGTFFLRNSNSTGAPDMIFSLGIPGDVGIAGDWDGDGDDTTGVFRPSNGALYLKNTNNTGFADIQINYGLPGDMPVTGDWDADGDDTIGIYRNGAFYLRNSNTIGFADIVFALGVPGDMPISGDWDGLPQP